MWPGPVLVGAAIDTGFYGELFLLSLHFQHVRLFTPVLAGLALLPQPGIASVASSLARFGPRPVMLIGLVFGRGAVVAWWTIPSSPRRA